MPTVLTKPFEKLSAYVKEQLMFAKDTLNNAKDKIVKTFKDAAPANRSFDIAAQRLRRIDNEKKVLVGSFVPELYEMAKAGKLKCLWEEAQWVDAKCKEQDAFKEIAQAGNNSPLYVAALQNEQSELFKKIYRLAGPEDNDGKITLKTGEYVRKTPFELALVKGGSKTEIARDYKAEFKFARGKNFAFPAFISKLRVKKDYLQELAKANLLADENDPHENKGFRVNFERHEDVVSLREGILHYTMHKASALLTLTVAIQAAAHINILAAPTPTDLINFALIIGATWYTTKHANDFGLFDVAETINRDISWLLSPDSRKGKWSPINTLKTALLLGAVGYAMYLAVPAIYHSSLALPLWDALITLGVNAQAVNLLGMGLALFASAITALQAWTLTYTQRFFEGLSLWDNQISFTPAMGSPTALPAIVVPVNKCVNNKEYLEHLAEKTPQPSHAKAVIEWAYEIILDAFKGIISSSPNSIKVAGCTDSNTIPKAPLSSPAAVTTAYETFKAGGQASQGGTRKSARLLSPAQNETQIGVTTRAGEKKISPKGAATPLDITAKTNGSSPQSGKKSDSPEETPNQGRAKNHQEPLPIGNGREKTPKESPTENRPKKPGGVIKATDKKSGAIAVPRMAQGLTFSKTAAALPTSRSSSQLVGANSKATKSSQTKAANGVNAKKSSRRQSTYH